LLLPWKHVWQVCAPPEAGDCGLRPQRGSVQEQELDNSGGSVVPGAVPPHAVLVLKLVGPGWSSNLGSVGCWGKNSGVVKQSWGFAGTTILPAGEESGDLVNLVASWYKNTPRPGRGTRLVYLLVGLETNIQQDQPKYSIRFHDPHNQRTSPSVGILLI